MDLLDVANEINACRAMTRFMAHATTEMLKEGDTFTPGDSMLSGATEIYTNINDRLQTATDALNDHIRQQSK